MPGWMLFPSQYEAEQQNRFRLEHNCDAGKLKLMFLKANFYSDSHVDSGRLTPARCQRENGAGQATRLSGQAV